MDEDNDGKITLAEVTRFFDAQVILKEATVDVAQDAREGVQHIAELIIKECVVYF